MLDLSLKNILKKYFFKKSFFLLEMINIIPKQILITINIRLKNYIYFLLLISIAKSQTLISADPSTYLINEHKLLVQNQIKSSLLLRPLFFSSDTSKLFILARNEFYYNDNYPNLENTGNLWIAKGLSLFSSINLVYASKNIIMIIEPFYFRTDNHMVNNIIRPAPNPSQNDIFNVLNDRRIHSSSPYKIYGLRESTLFVHHKKVGLGISNSNMWWGPGIHTSLTMTNNTSGFPYLVIGTINEKKYKNIGLNIRYIFSQLSSNSGKPFYSALVFSARIHSKPIISFGFSRNYISGGLPTDRNFTIWDAAKLPFEWLFIDTKIDKYPSDWEAHDRWDQTAALYLTMEYPSIGLIIFIELGTDDHRQNWSDLRSQPDHNSANIIGMRKYGLFNNSNIFSGFEYANIKKSYTNIFRGGGDWWRNSFYDYSTFDGRRWAAHSGTDSDDFYLYFGYNTKSWTIMPGFNYERHGIVFADRPELKIEFRLDLRFNYNEYLIKIYYEHELFNNVSFNEDNKMRSNIISFGIQRDLSHLSNYIFN